MPYQNLKVWKKSHELAKNIYKETETFPVEEKYAITSQIRRAATSIPINIAEGKGTTYDSKFINFLDIARASSYEVDYLLMFTNEIGYLDDLKCELMRKETKEITSMLSSLILKLKKQSK